MKRSFIIMTAFICSVNANCQNNKILSDYFPDIQNRNTIIESRYLFDLNSRNPLDTIVALKYFFDNDSKKMHDIFEAYNMDKNTYTLIPYIKEIYALFKIKKQDIYLLCYGKESAIYLAIYDYKNDRIENSFVVVYSPDGEFDVFTRSTVFPNGFIVTVQAAEKTFYILSRIDYETRKFIELKKIETDSSQSYDTIIDNAFEALRISREGELLE